MMPLTGAAPSNAVLLLHQLHLLPQVFTPPQQLVNQLGPDFGGAGVQLMAAAEELIEAVHLVVSMHHCPRITPAADARHWMHI